MLCLPGLTRNCRDFEPLAPSASPANGGCSAPDLRGRGDSDYAKDSASYQPLQYAADILALLDQLGIDRFVAVGTSLGGM